MSESSTGLIQRLRSRMAEAAATGFGPWSHEVFNRLALEVFAAQFEGCEAYGRFCEGRGAIPGAVDDWKAIPAVPATAFKHLDLYSGPGEPELAFVTSGTTGGSERRGRHPVASLELYRSSCLEWFGRHLIPENEPIRILCLVPSPDHAPASSLSRMMRFAVDEWGTEGSAFFGTGDGSVELKAFHGALRSASDEGVPVLVMGTAFAWVHWLDWRSQNAVPVALPRGSRLMETGGFKGRSRTVARADLYAALAGDLGVPEARMVNEYGMTELLSQLYEPVLNDPTSERRHLPPPWLRVRALDPDTLQPRPAGQRGLLAFFDLANAGSVSAILTEDVGVVHEEGSVKLEGRAPGAEPRGCSLAMEQLLNEAGR